MRHLIRPAHHRPHCRCHQSRRRRRCHYHPHRRHLLQSRHRRHPRPRTHPHHRHHPRHLPLLCHGRHRHRQHRHFSAQFAQPFSTGLPWRTRLPAFASSSKGDGSSAGQLFTARTAPFAMVTINFVSRRCHQHHRLCHLRLLYHHRPNLLRLFLCYLHPRHLHLQCLRLP